MSRAASIIENIAGRAGGAFAAERDARHNLARAEQSGNHKTLAQACRDLRDARRAFVARITAELNKLSNELEAEYLDTVSTLTPREDK